MKLPKFLKRKNKVDPEVLKQRISDLETELSTIKEERDRIQAAWQQSQTLITDLKKQIPK